MKLLIFVFVMPTPNCFGLEGSSGTDDHSESKSILRFFVGAAIIAAPLRQIPNRMGFPSLSVTIGHSSNESRVPPGVGRPIRRTL